MTAKTAFPAADIDLFSDQHLENPYPDYKSLRDAGPVVPSCQTPRGGSSR